MTEQKAEITPSVGITPSPGDFKEKEQFYQQVAEYAKKAGGIFESQDPAADYKTFVKELKDYQNTEIPPYLLDKIKQGNQVLIFRGVSSHISPENFEFQRQHPDYVPISQSSPYVVFVIDPFNYEINARMTFKYPGSFGFVKSLDSYCGDRKGLEELKCVHSRFHYSSMDRDKTIDYFKVYYGLRLATGELQMRPGRDWTIRTGSVKDSLVITVYKDGSVTHYQYLWDPKAQKWYDKTNQFDTIRDVIKHLGLSEFGSSLYE
jgi:hypothetical protein